MLIGTAAELAKYTTAASAPIRAHLEASFCPLFWPGQNHN
jgi:hypothetical protein